jgi:RHS repeat-associated protein
VNASGDQYVHAPEGSGKPDDPSDNYAGYCFSVTTAGTYRIKGWVYAAGGNSDSFFVRVDSSPVHGYLWDTLHNTSYALDYVNDRDTAADPLEVSLGVGNHTVVVYQRDDGTRLDRLELERVTGESAGSGGRLGLLSPSRLVKRAANALSKAYSLVPPTEGTVHRSYYYAGGQRVAVRETSAGGSAVYYLLGDHLGSSSVTTDDDGNKLSELRYKPWGELRYAWGDPNTDRRFTGQRLDSIGLHHYGARFYDESLGRFIQPDTLISNPLNPLAYDRYQYVYGNPINNFDASGHVTCNRRGCDSVRFDDPISSNVISLMVNPVSELEGRTGVVTQYVAVQTKRYY